MRRFNASLKVKQHSCYTLQHNIEIKKLDDKMLSYRRETALQGAL